MWDRVRERYGRKTKERRTKQEKEKKGEIKTQLRSRIQDGILRTHTQKKGEKQTNKKRKKDYKEEYTTTKPKTRVGFQLEHTTHNKPSCSSSLSGWSINGYLGTPEGAKLC